MPEIPVGDIVRSFKLPSWLRWVMNLVKGVRITKGGTTIVLNEKPTPGLKESYFDDKPAKVEPPQRGRTR